MEERLSSDFLRSQYALAFHRDRLSASDMLQVRKVMEHVYEKIINLDNESQTTSSSNNEKPGEQEKEEDIAVLAEEKIELLCQDQVSGLASHSPTFPVLGLRKSHNVVQFWFPSLLPLGGFCFERDFWEHCRSQIGEAPSKRKKRGPS